MGKGNYDKYKYVKAEIVKAAAYGDDDALYAIFKRYEGDIVKLIERRIKRLDLWAGYFPFDELMNTVWIGMREAVRKYRPR